MGQSDVSKSLKIGDVISFVLPPRKVKIIAFEEAGHRLAGVKWQDIRTGQEGFSSMDYIRQLTK